MAKLSDKHIVPRGLVRVLGYDHAAAYALSKIVAWHKYAKKKDLGVTKTDDEWCEDLEVTKKQLRRIKERLERLGLIERNRAPWGKRLSASFIKPTWLGTSLALNSPYWAPPKCPIGQLEGHSTSPNGHDWTLPYCPDGPFLILIETKTNKNADNAPLKQSGHACAWSSLPTSDFYEVVSREEVNANAPVTIGTIPRLVAQWEQRYMVVYEQETAPVWLPVHIRHIEDMVQSCVNEYVKCYTNPDPAISDDDPVPLEKVPLESIRAEAEQEVCWSLAITLYWSVQEWEQLLETIKGNNLPQKPEIDFILFNLDEVSKWANELNCDSLTDENFFEDWLYLKRHLVEGFITRFESVCAETHPSYEIESWSKDQLVTLIKSVAFAFDTVIEGVRYWDEWRSFKWNSSTPTPFSIDALLTDIVDIKDEFDLFYFAGYGLEKINDTALRKQLLKERESFLLNLSQTLQ